MLLLISSFTLSLIGCVVDVVVGVGCVVDVVVGFVVGVIVGVTVLVGCVVDVVVGFDLHFSLIKLYVYSLISETPYKSCNFFKVIGPKLPVCHFFLNPKHI